MLGCHLIVTSLLSVSDNAEGGIDRRCLALDLFPGNHLICAARLGYTPRESLVPSLGKHAAS